MGSGNLLSPSDEPRETVAFKGLRENSIGLARSIALGLASVAPAYSLAVTLGFVVLAVGNHAPAAFLIGFVPILLTAFAMRDLNRDMPDCGATFVWISRAFGPVAGWFAGGWVPQIASFIAMAALAQVATTYLLTFVGLAAWAANPFLTTAIACGFIALTTLVAARGLEVAAWIQYALIALQLVAIGGFCVGAFLNVAHGTAMPGAQAPSLDWLNPFAFSSFSSLTEGVLLCLFIYWGWDALISVNEETTDSSRTPGRAAIISTVILLVCYGSASFAALSFAGPGAHGLGDPAVVGDVLSALGSSATGAIFGQIITLAVGLSALAALLTVSVSMPRYWLSMSVFRALPSHLSRMNKRWGTPLFGTIAIGVVGILVTVILSSLSQNFLGDAILAIGLLIAFYYGATAFACVYYFRKQFAGSPKALFVKGILPGLGGALMTVAFVESAIDMIDVAYGSSSWLGIGSVFWLGIGGLVLGVVAVLIARPLFPAFFDGATLPMGDATSAPLAVVVRDDLVIVVDDTELLVN